MKVGLVLEGGAMRGMYTLGVIDTLLKNNIEVAAIMGVSAGALFGVNYFSKQIGRGIRYSLKYAKDPRYISVLSYLFTGNVINKSFAFYKVTEKLDIFDNKEFIKTNKPFYAVATNIETGKPDYILIKNPIEQMEALRATSAMPLVSKIVSYDNNLYLDGAITDSIPYKKMKKLEYDKIIVVLTRDINYKKTPITEKQINQINKKYKDYPKLIEAMINRYDVYNKTIEDLKKDENKGNIFVIRPSKEINIKPLEKNKDTLKSIYDMGVNDTNNYLKELKEYLKK